MKLFPFTLTGHCTRAVVGKAVAESCILAVTCLASYVVTTQVSAHVSSFSHSSDLLGGMWAVMLVAALALYCSWKQPTLRLVHIATDTPIGLAAVWISPSRLRSGRVRSDNGRDV